MALTAEQKRKRRATASQQQRDHDSARKRKSRLDNPQQEHVSRKQRREKQRAAADAGDEQANVVLDAAARRSREYRGRIREQADAAYANAGADDIDVFTGEWRGAVAQNPAVLQLQREARRKHFARLPGVEAHREERAQARKQRDATVAAAKQHYVLCRQEESCIRAQWYGSRKRIARFSGGALCTASACKHKMCSNAVRRAEAEAEEQRRREREQEAMKHRKDAHEALQAARRQPLRTPCASPEARESEAWCCDVGVEGCIKPCLSAPEPMPPYVIWICNARRPCDWCVCSACHTSEHGHPHVLVPVTDSERLSD